MWLGKWRLLDKVCGGGGGRIGFGQLDKACLCLWVFACVCLCGCVEVVCVGWVWGGGGLSWTGVYVCLCVGCRTIGLTPLVCLPLPVPLQVDVLLVNTGQIEHFYWGKWLSLSGGCTRVSPIQVGTRG